MNTIGESRPVVNRMKESRGLKICLTGYQPYVTCSPNFLSKMGSVSDATLLQVPVGNTRQMRVAFSVHRSDIRLRGVAA